MVLRAVAWTVILAGLVALGTVKKQWEVGFEMFVESPETARIAARLTHTEDRDHLGLGLGDSHRVRDENAIRVQTERANAERARAELLAKLQTEARWYERILNLSLVVGLAGLLFLGLATRRHIRDWHWLTVVSFAAIAATVYVLFTVREPASHYACLPFNGLSIAAAALDLRRRRYSTPGRVFAWAALWTSVLFGVILLCAAIG